MSPGVPKAHGTTDIAVHSETMGLAGNHKSVQFVSGGSRLFL